MDVLSAAAASVAAIPTALLETKAQDPIDGNGDEKVHGNADETPTRQETSRSRHKKDKGSKAMSPRDWLAGGAIRKFKKLSPMSPEDPLFILGVAYRVKLAYEKQQAEVRQCLLDEQQRRIRLVEDSLPRGREKVLIALDRHVSEHVKAMRKAGKPYDFVLPEEYVADALEIWTFCTGHEKSLRVRIGPFRDLEYALLDREPSATFDAIAIGLLLAIQQEQLGKSARSLVNELTWPEMARRTLMQCALRESHTKATAKADEEEPGEGVEGAVENGDEEQALRQEDDDMNNVDDNNTSDLMSQSVMPVEDEGDESEPTWRIYERDPAAVFVKHDAKRPAMPEAWNQRIRHGGGVTKTDQLVTVWSDLCKKDSAFRLEFLERVRGVLNRIHSEAAAKLLWTVDYRDCAAANEVPFLADWCAIEEMARNKSITDPRAIISAVTELCTNMKHLLSKKPKETRRDFMDAIDSCKALFDSLLTKWVLTPPPLTKGVWTVWAKCDPAETEACRVCRGQRRFPKKLVAPPTIRCRSCDIPFHADCYHSYISGEPLAPLPSVSSLNGTLNSSKSKKAASGSPRAGGKKEDKKDEPFVCNVCTAMEAQSVSGDLVTNMDVKDDQDSDLSVLAWKGRTRCAVDEPTRLKLATDIPSHNSWGGLRGGKETPKSLIRLARKLNTCEPAELDLRERLRLFLFLCREASMTTACREEAEEALSKARELQADFNRFKRQWVDECAKTLTTVVGRYGPVYKREYTKKMPRFGPVLQVLQNSFDADLEPRETVDDYIERAKRFVEEGGYKREIECRLINNDSGDDDIVFTLTTDDESSLGEDGEETESEYDSEDSMVPQPTIMQRRMVDHASRPIATTVQDTLSPVTPSTSPSMGPVTASNSVGETTTSAEQPLAYGTKLVEPCVTSKEVSTSPETSKDSTMVKTSDEQQNAIPLSSVAVQPEQRRALDINVKRFESFLKSKDPSAIPDLTGLDLALARAVEVGPSAHALTLQIRPEFLRPGSSEATHPAVYEHTISPLRLALPVLQSFDSSVTSPVFMGVMHSRVNTALEEEEFRNEDKHRKKKKKAAAAEAAGVADQSEASKGSAAFVLDGRKRRHRRTKSEIEAERLNALVTGHSSEKSGGGLVSFRETQNPRNKVCPLCAIPFSNLERALHGRCQILLDHINELGIVNNGDKSAIQQLATVYFQAEFDSLMSGFRCEPCGTMPPSIRFWRFRGDLATIYEEDTATGKISVCSSIEKVPLHIKWFLSGFGFSAGYTGKSKILTSTLFAPKPTLPLVLDEILLRGQAIMGCVTGSLRPAGVENLDKCRFCADLIRAQDWHCLACHHTFLNADEAFMLNHVGQCRSRSEYLGSMNNVQTCLYGPNNISSKAWRKFLKLKQIMLECEAGLPLAATRFKIDLHTGDITAEQRQKVRILAGGWETDRRVMWIERVKRSVTPMQLMKLWKVLENTVDPRWLELKSCIPPAPVAKVGSDPASTVNQVDSMNHAMSASPVPPGVNNNDTASNADNETSGIILPTGSQQPAGGVPLAALEDPFSDVVVAKVALKVFALDQDLRYDCIS